MNEKPVAIVTGGATGIGAACCRALADKGFRVGIHYRSSAGQAGELLAQIGDGFLLQGDLARTDEVDRMVAEIKEVAGRVDCLVNNAGQSINADINSMRLDQFDEQRAILRGTWYLTKRILRLFMLRKGTGRIINISSVVGSTGNPGQIPYTMEKAALDAFTKSLARELAGRNILVNAVAPGFIDTEMVRAIPDAVKDLLLAQVPLGRMGRPEEVAEVVAFLAVSASYVNGTVLHVNGGLYGG
jgi:3-oxoacyl-[acyl-carrier protein] reductase